MTSNDDHQQLNDDFLTPDGFVYAKGEDRHVEGATFSVRLPGPAGVLQYDRPGAQNDRCLSSISV